MIFRAGWRFDRAHRGAGVLRQFAVIAAATDRMEGLRTMKVPTVVGHGDRDPLLGVRGARATAEAAGGELVVVPGIGTGPARRRLGLDHRRRRLQCRRRVAARTGRVEL